MTTDSWTTNYWPFNKSWTLFCDYFLSFGSDMKSEELDIDSTWFQRISLTAFASRHRHHCLLSIVYFLKVSLFLFKSGSFTIILNATCFFFSSVFWYQALKWRGCDSNWSFARLWKGRMWPESRRFSILELDDSFCWIFGCVCSEELLDLINKLKKEREFWSMIHFVPFLKLPSMYTDGSKQRK